MSSQGKGNRVGQEVGKMKRLANGVGENDENEEMRRAGARLV